MNAQRLGSLMAVVVACSSAAHSSAAPDCPEDNAGLTLPAGFCAKVAAEGLGPVRHLVVTEAGDVLAAVRGNDGGVVALRDIDGDGRLERQGSFGPGGGSGIALNGGYLYFATDDAVVRWAWTADQLVPAGAPDTVAHGLLNRRQHAAKGIAVGPGGALYVNIGAPSNSCQEADRQPGVPGRDPCELLEVSGGIWRFAAGGQRQSQADGERFATGLRNTLALAIEPATGALYGVQHGRDDLHRLWPDLYTEAQNTELPAEELFRIERGGDYGWPYCYYDPAQRKKVLSPEYGGDGRQVGRCASARDPEVAFPAHWAPNGLVFYAGTQFPESYRGGAFVAFHGSWNRSPVQAGYNVVFAPFRNGRAVGTYEVFARGFAREDLATSRDASHRPTGLAVGPDGSLYVSDDRGGRIYRITYQP